MIRETLPEGRSYDTPDFGHSDEDDFPSDSVPAGHVFVMGDDSDDSRVPEEQNGLGGGGVPIENIGGAAEFVTVSLNGNASWNPFSWVSAFREGRFAISLHPQAGG